MSVDRLRWPLTISHRGGPGIYPEHSWEAKTGSMSYGFVPEFDLRLLSDGQTLVNCHDPTVDRTMINIGSGPVSAKTVEQWRRARIRPAISGGAEGRPVFWDEVLDKWGGRVVLIPELKDAAATGVFLESIVSRGLQRSVLAQTADYGVALQFVAAGVETLYLSETPPKEHPEAIKAAGINFYGGNIARTPTSVVAAMKAAGLKTLGYTVHTLTEATTAAALAWDGLFSDDAWRTTESIPVRSGDPFGDGIRPYGMDVYCYDALGDATSQPSVPIRLAGRRLGFSQPASPTPYASQPWAGKLLARPLQVSMRLWFGTGGDQTAGLGFALSSAASGLFRDGARARQNGFSFVVQRNGQLAAWAYVDGAEGVLLGATPPVPGCEYAPAGREAVVAFSVIMTGREIVLHAQGGSGSQPAQQLVIANAFAPRDLELYLRWVSSTAGASGFFSDIDIAGL